MMYYQLKKGWHVIFLQVEIRLYQIIFLIQDLEGNLIFEYKFSYKDY